jgi:hypothetical protein
MSDIPEGARAPDEELDLGVIDEIEPEPEPMDDEIEPEPDVDPDPEPPRQTRQERRDDRARSRARELETQNADLARRLAQLEARQTQPVVDPGAAARDEAQFRESLQMMLPHEAALAVVERSERRMAAQLQQARVEGFDRADTAQFEALRARDRAAERLAPQVEATMAAARAQGDFRFSRVDIFDFLRGREIRLKGPAAAQQQRRAGAARVAAQTTTPTGGRGDVARSAGRERSQDAADEALLRNIRAGDV